MNILLWVLQVLAALVYAASGYMIEAYQSAEAARLFLIYCY